jgi:colanic acid/amylovoran biosynthesis protein
MTTPHFLLVGNGSYRNRGCEAIVRGTMVILRHEFGEEFRVTLGTLASPDTVAEQAAKEFDPLITHLSLRGMPIHRWSRAWWRRRIPRWFLKEQSPFRILDRACKGARCALQVGGDNYTLDYGVPQLFMQLDDYLNRHRLPIVLWGASVGPFDADPEFAPTMFAHLRAMRGIFVRESDSYEYLRTNGVDANLHRMPDPAFLLEPVEPPAEKLARQVPSGVIGLNLSPLMGRYITNGNTEAWVKNAADIVHSIVESTHRPILLIPHVTSPHTNDHAFLSSVAAACWKANTENVSVLGGNLTAAETKWVISKCAAFAGARTHSTIAAISTCVPTLSLAYSRKAQGLNRDIFGTQDYCLQPSEMSPANVAQRIMDLLARRDVISKQLANVLPEIRASALQSGSNLRNVLKVK